MAEKSSRFASGYGWWPGSGLIPFREWARRECPGVEGDSGLVLTDSDVVVRVYGPKYHLDDVGAFCLLELVTSGRKLRYGQQRTFELMNTLMRLGERLYARGGNRYRGRHVLDLHYSGPAPKCPVCEQEITNDPEAAYERFRSVSDMFLDGKPIKHDELRHFLLFGDVP